MTENTTAYFARQRELVAFELHDEEQAYQRSLQMRANNLTGEIREAACRYPVRLGSYGTNSIWQTTLDVRFAVNEDESENEFEPEKPITFFYLHDDGSGATALNVQCLCEGIGDGLVVVSIPNKAAQQSINDIAQRHLLGIQIGVDNTSYRVMNASLTEAERKEDEKFTNLRSVIIGQKAASFRQLPKVSFSWLNTSQNEAIQKVVEAEEVAIIHGPPGTGKTTTLVEAVIETLQRETQVLVCAPSNAAVDWISEQLIRRGIGVLRVGNPLRMSNEILNCSYERRYSAHPDYHELWNIRRAIAHPSDRDVQGAVIQKKLRERANELEMKIKADIFNEASVVSCTLIGSAYRLLEHRRFSTLFIDEAAQALEPACWAAILKTDRVIMSGDHQQLPPTVKSREAVKGGMACTLMQKMQHHQPNAVTMLNVQYRMNEDIMGFSSHWFYHGKLQAAQEAKDRLVSPLDTPLMWLDTSVLDYKEAENKFKSRTNAQEARLVIHALRDYIEMISPTKIESERIDFGIITPYRGQARLIRRLIKIQHYFQKLKRHISVGTVDGFQGQERDVIIISLVRDNAEGNIGFLKDLRRMNVAMTRARMKLIIVGNTETLCENRFYRELIEYFKQKGSLVTIRPDPQKDDSPT